MLLISRKPNARLLPLSWLPGVAHSLGDEILTSIGMLHVGNQARAFASSMRPK
jgi:hypothetical protein